MKIRQMQLSDFEDLYELWKQAGLSVVDKLREKTEVAEIIKMNGETCFVLVDKEKIVGSIMGAFNGRRGWIYHLAVHPDWQRKRYGSNLFENR